MTSNAPLATVVALAVLSFTSSAFAAPAAGSASNSDGISISVPLSGLDLSNQAGAATALRRIDNAAKVVCGGEPNIGDLQPTALYRACFRTAVDGAVASMHNPIVTALKGQGREPIVVAAGFHN